MKKFLTILCVAGALAATSIAASAEENLEVMPIAEDTAVVTSAEDAETGLGGPADEDIGAEAEGTEVDADGTEAEADGTEAEANGEETNTEVEATDTTVKDADKGSPDTGVAGVAAIAGAAVVAGGVLLLAGKKRD